MEARIKIYKRRFDSDLRHIKLILMQYRDTMQRDEWMTLVKETKSCILENPQDFFGENLPAKKITAKVIQLVFDGFIKDMHIRHVQAFRKVY